MLIELVKLDSFLLTQPTGETYSADQVIVATGLFKANQPNIPGIELAANYTNMSINPDDYTNKRLLILGKGNSAFETAEHLIGSACLIHCASPEPLTMAWRSHYPGHLRAVNCNLLDTYQLKSQNALINAEVKKIEKKGERFLVTFAYNYANDEVESIEYDAVVSCAGFCFDHSMFDQTCLPALSINDRFPEQTNKL